MMARYPLTLTIDEMPESERPKRTVSLETEEPPAEQPKRGSSYEPGISIENCPAYKRILYAAILPFPEARAAIATAFGKMRRTLKLGEPVYEPA